MTFGGFIGVESYINRFVSASFDIYPINMGNYTTAPDVKFGMRMYL
jgi:nitrate/nitrite transporter NarK